MYIYVLFVYCMATCKIVHLQTHLTIIHMFLFFIVCVRNRRIPHAYKEQAYARRPRTHFRTEHRHFRIHLTLVL